MKKYVHSFILITASAVLIAPENSSAVTRVSRMMNVVDFFVGGSMPVGTRNGLPDYDFSTSNGIVDVDSEDIYENSFHFGFRYGQLRYSHLLFSIGFRYTKHELQDTIPLDMNTILTVDSSVKHNQYDVEFDLDYYFIDPLSSSFSPYAGLGLRAGLTSISQSGFDSEHSANLALSLNFGADLKIWSSSDNRTYVSLASINSYDFYGSNDRAKYLNIGGALKYYFRP